MLYRAKESRYRAHILGFHLYEKAKVIYSNKARLVAD